MLFKDNTYLQLWMPFCPEEQICLHNFGRGQYEAHFCETILQGISSCFLSEFCMETKSLNHFERRPSKDLFYEVW